MAFSDLKQDWFDPYKPLVLGLLIGTSIALEVFVHGVLGIGVVYSHFFYLPIVLGAVWYGVRALPVSLLLSAVYLGNTYALTGSLGLDATLRAGMFVAVALLIGILTDSLRRRQDQLADQVAQSALKGIPRRGGKIFLPGIVNVKRMRQERDIADLVRALSHKDTAVQYEAADALGELRDPSAVLPLMEVLTQDRYSGVRWKAAESLAKIGSPAVEALIGALRHPDEDVRWKAAIALGEIGDVAAVPPLIQLLGDTDRFVRSRAAYALGEFGPAATPSLCEALSADDPAIRQGAARALRKIRDPAARDALTRAMTDPDESVRAAVLEALMALGEEGYRTILSFLSGAGPTERSAISSALKEVSEQRLLSGFLPLLDGADGEARASIRAILGTQGGPERPGSP
ncbi:MAG: HEAT repeat domain-containing protein [Methanolinea sp.]|nr:HEAT repeat domain-containing protein [Methanolinea sp.]